MILDSARIEAVRLLLVKWFPGTEVRVRVPNLDAAVVFDLLRRRDGMRRRVRIDRERFLDYGLAEEILLPGSRGAIDETSVLIDSAGVAHVEQNPTG